MEDKDRDIGEEREGGATVIGTIDEGYNRLEREGGVVVEIERL